MKILYFSRSYTPHDFRFLSAIIEGGHRVYFLRLESGTISETRPFPRGVRAVSGTLKEVIAQTQPDLIHAGPLPDCGYQAAGSGFHPLVQMSWGSDILWEGQRSAAARKRVLFALASADVVIGDCKAVRQAATKLGVPASRIVTFPWGVDLSRYKPISADDGLRKKLGWQKKFVLLHVRAWEPLYDPLTVVRAFVRAARRNSELRLLMPGSGSLDAKMHRILDNAGLQDRVHLPGQVSQDDLPDYYRAADIYISASLSDGSSVSLMEALASGRPAIVTDIRGNREWVQEGKEGWLFPAKDVLALDRLILKSIGYKHFAKLGERARQKAELRANWGQNKKGLFEAYELALEANS